MKSRSLRPTLPYHLPTDRRAARESWGRSGSAHYRDCFPGARRLAAPRPDRIGTWLARHGGQVVTHLICIGVGVFIGWALGTAS